MNLPKITLTWIHYPKPIIRFLQESVKSCGRRLLSWWNVFFAQEIMIRKAFDDGIFDGLLTQRIDQS